MIRRSKRFILIQLRELLAFFEEFLQSEEVAVDTLAVCGPRGIL